jgi:hypothetical protein
MAWHRSDNRTVSYIIAEGQATTIDIDAAGNEPLVVQIEGTGQLWLSYQQGGPWIKYPADTMLSYDVNHPFREETTFYAPTGNITLTFHISGYVHKE